MGFEYIRYGPMYGKSLYGNARERDLDGGLDPRAHSLTAHSETGREAGEIMRRMQSGSERRLIPQADVHC